MLFLESFLLIVSIIMLTFVAIYSLRNRNTRGATELFFLMTSAIVWTAGSFCEMVASEFEVMLVFRNIQQIGVFSVPLFTLWFAIIYSKKENLNKYMYPIAFVQLVSVILIFTNEIHGIMRKGYLIEESEYFGEVLIVQSTIVGEFLVSFNFLLPVFAIVILFAYRQKLAKNNRREISLIIFSFLFTFIVSFLKESLLKDIGIYISISTLYTPSAIIMFYCLYKYNFLNLSPVARDKIFEIINQGIVILDDKKKIIDLNEYAKNMLCGYGISEDKLLGRKIGDYKEKSSIYKIISKVEEENREVLVEKENQKKYYSVSSYPLKENKYKTIGWVLLLNDITTKKEYELQLKRYAEIDALTQIYNRATFQRKYEKNKCCSIQYCSFLIIDLDHFKKINDTYGHVNGDKVLIRFSKMLKDYIGEKGFVGRLGGEEFGIILYSIKKEDGFLIAEKFREMIEETEFITDNEENIKYTISIGIADNGGKYKKFEKIFNEADLALYEAKRISRNCTVIFESDLLS